MLATKFKGYITLALLCTLGLCGFYIWLQSNQVEKLQLENGAISQALQNTSASLAKMQKLSEENQQAQAKLRQQLAKVRTVTTNRQQTIQDLKRELNDVKAWANTLLPLSITSLHDRPKITGSTQYRKWLSHRDTLPATSQQNNDERKPKQ